MYLILYPLVALILIFCVSASVLYFKVWDLSTPLIYFKYILNIKY